MNATFRKAIVLSIILLLLFPLKNLACTAFLLNGKDYCLVGFNENWKTMPGMVVINKYGIKKQNLSWDLLSSPNGFQDKTMNWTAQYGSVTFNLLGYDLPCYGVNEKGLFVVELSLEKTIPVKNPSQANMFWGQWIQYQLDNYSSVEEVVTNLNNAPVIDWWPSAVGSHFFISDGKGNTAAIEGINGVFKITQKTDMPIPLLCNEEYSQDLANIQQYDFMGGKKPFDVNAPVKWENRFTKAACMLTKFDASKENPLDYSWKILNGVFAGEWQTIADIRNRKIYFRSNIGKEIKSIDMKLINFSPDSPIQFIDINSTLAGDVTRKLENLTQKINQKYIIDGFPIGYDNREFPASTAFENIITNLNIYFSKILKQ